MTKHAKFLNRLMSGHSDADIAFDDLCSLLKQFDFQVRVHGDHHRGGADLREGAGHR